MMKVCIYCNRKYPDGDITFHKIPSDKERRQKWLNAMKLPDENVDKKSYLCSEHFEKNTFCCQIVNKVVHRFLHINAVPSIFIEKHCTPAENEDLNGLDKRIKDNQNGSIQLSKECDEGEEEEDDDVDNGEDCYYYKIENGIIKRYLRQDLNTSVLLPRSKQENFSKSNEGNLEENFNTKSIELKNGLYTENTQDVEYSKVIHVEAPVKVEVSKAIHVEAPVKVEVLPDIQLPMQIRNGEIYLKDNICDFKANECNDHNGPNIIYEDIRIDAEEIPYEQIIEFSNVNGINEVEVTTCESESLEIVQQETTNDLENVDMKVEELKMDVDNLYKDTVVNSDTEEIKKQKNDNIKNDQITNGSSEIRDNCLKELLNECLEKNERVDINIKLKKCTKLSLTELLKMALNYIQSLEDKLKVSVEKNKQYEYQILELKNLLQSISNIDMDKSNSI